MKFLKLLASNIFISIFFFCQHVNSQSYTIEKTIGGEGEIGEKIKYNGDEFALGTNSFYFIDEFSGKRIYQVDEKGILINKYNLKYFTENEESYYTNIEYLKVDNLGNFIILSEFKRDIQYFNSDGDLLFNVNLGNLDNFFNKTFFDSEKIAVNSDSKNNIYLGTDHNLLIINNKGTLLKTIGIKGTGDGQFNSKILKIMIDSADNIYVWADRRIQKFNSSGEFIGKTPLNLAYLDIDYEATGFYCATASEIQVVNNEGTVTSKIALAGATRLNFFNGNLFIDKGQYTNKALRYGLYDKNGILKNEICQDRFENSFSELIDFRLDNSGNLIAHDSYLLKKYAQNGSKSPTPSNYELINKLGFAFDNLIDVKSESNFIYIDYRSNDEVVNKANLNTKVIEPIFINKETSYIKSFLIDSTYKDFVVYLENNNTDKGEIILYNFDGTVKKNIFTSSFLLGVALGLNGQIIVARKLTEYGEFEIVILNREGVVLNRFNTKIGEFGDIINGIAVDQTGIIHFGVLNALDNFGLSIYAFNEAGLAKGSYLRLSDNTGSRSFVTTHLIQIQNGNIYFGDQENSKIMLLKYWPEINAKPVASITINDIFKKLGEADFKLNPTSTSNAPFVFTIISGESVSVGSDGLVKILKPGNTIIKISQATNDSYEANSKTIIVEIISNAAIITAINPIFKNIDDSDFKLNPVSNSKGVFSFKVSAGDAVSVDATGTVKIIKAGKATIQIDQTANGGIDAGTLVVEITVNKLSQTITYTSPPTSLFNNNLGEILDAKSSSGLPITYKIISGPATMANINTLKPTGAIGKVVIEASQTGNNIFAEAKIFKFEIAIIAAPVLSEEVIVLEPNNLVYPNPTNNNLNIYNKNGYDKYQIIDIIGRVLKFGNLKLINSIYVEKIPAGVYNVVLTGKGQNDHITKIIMIK